MQLAHNLLPYFGLHARSRDVEPLQTQSGSFQTIVMAGRTIAIEELTLAGRDRRLT
jgi:hypothetical protein